MRLGGAAVAVLLFVFVAAGLERDLLSAPARAMSPGAMSPVVNSPSGEGQSGATTIFTLDDIAGQLAPAPPADQPPGPTLAAVIEGESGRAARNQGLGEVVFALLGYLADDIRFLTPKATGLPSVAIAEARPAPPPALGPAPIPLPKATLGSKPLLAPVLAWLREMRDTAWLPSSDRLVTETPERGDGGRAVAESSQGDGSSSLSRVATQALRVLQPPKVSAEKPGPGKPSSEPLHLASVTRAPTLSVTRAYPGFGQAFGYDSRTRPVVLRLPPKSRLLPQSRAQLPGVVALQRPIRLLRPAPKPRTRSFNVASLGLGIAPGTSADSLGRFLETVSPARTAARGRGPRQPMRFDQVVDRAQSAGNGFSLAQALGGVAAPRLPRQGHQRRHALVQDLRRVAY